MKLPAIVNKSSFGLDDQERTLAATHAEQSLNLEVPEVGEGAEAVVIEVPREGGLPCQVLDPEPKEVVPAHRSEGDLPCQVLDRVESTARERRGEKRSRTCKSCRRRNCSCLSKCETLLYRRWVQVN